MDRRSRTGYPDIESGSGRRRGRERDPAVALGVPVFRRTEKFAALLDSVEATPVSTVYVADNGDAEDRDHLYDRPHGFDIELLDLDRGARLGRARRAIADAVDEPYLVLVDSDFRVPPNVGVLVEQLRAAPAFGGVGGLLLEHGRISGMYHDLHEDGDLLIRDTPGEKPVRDLAGHPFVEFDFIPNAAVLRTDCFADYTWDPAYVIGKEHLDFYVGHHRRTGWRFGVCPEVLFRHDPGGDAGFVQRRHDPSRLMESKRRFLTKWGYSQILRRRYWLDRAHPDPPMMTLARALPRIAQPRFLDLNDALWTLKGKALDGVGRLATRR